MKITDDIFWTGYIDWNLRNFHGYSTPYGSTYNAYLIPDEKPTLIDTVKYYGFSDMLDTFLSGHASGYFGKLMCLHRFCNHSLALYGTYSPWYIASLSACTEKSLTYAHPKNRV